MFLGLPKAGTATAAASGAGRLRRLTPYAGESARC
jgi:hypothetical protein